MRRSNRERQVTIFRRQQRSPRLWLPSEDGQAIRIDMVEGVPALADGAPLGRPLTIGYGADCDLRLDGGAGPGVLFELQHADRRVRLQTVPPGEDVDRFVELYVNGEPASARAQTVGPGSRVELVDRSSGRRYGFVVDPARRWWLRPRVLLAIVAVLTVAGGIYGAYLYLAIERTQGGLSETRGRVEETSRRFERLLERFESAEADFGRSLLDLEAALGASEQQLRGDFDGALAEIGRRSREAMQQIEERDVKARAALESRTRAEIEQLRLEFSDRMVEAYRDFKTAEARLVDAFGRRMQALEPASERFKRVFRRTRESVVFVQVRYRIEFVRSGEKTESGAFGTGFIVGASGLGLTAQHVLYPWRYDEQLAVLLALDLARVPQDSVRWSIWPTGARVATSPAAPAGNDSPAGDEAGLSGYHSDSPERGMRVLYAPEPTMAKELVAAPIGMVEVSVPKPDHTDVAVFELTGAEEALASLPEIDAGLEIETLDESVVIGYPFSRLQAGVALPQGVRGSVRRVGPTMIELDTPLHPGLSGAPVLDGEGRLLGMVVAVLHSDVYGVAIRAPSLQHSLAIAAERVRRGAAAR